MAIQHILFPTDFSDSARHAGGYAAALARGTKARVTILHVLMPPLPPSTLPSDKWLTLSEEMARQEEARAREMLRALTEEGDLRDLPTQTKVGTGPVERAILDAVEALAVDLVVMGTHGRGPVGRALLGGVTNNVVRLSPRAVLAVRWSGARIRTPWGKVLVEPAIPGGAPGFARILVPLDGSPLAEGILPQVKDLARAFRSTLTIVQVVEPPAYPMLNVVGVEAQVREEALRYLNRVKGGMAADGFQVQVEVLFGAPAVAILECAARGGVDIIAMATHGHGGLTRWLLGSVAEKVLSASDVPVLLYRAWGGAT